MLCLYQVYKFSSIYYSAPIRLTLEFKIIQEVSCVVLNVDDLAVFVTLDSLTYELIKQIQTMLNTNTVVFIYCQSTTALLLLEFMCK